MTRHSTLLKQVWQIAARSQRYQSSHTGSTKCAANHEVWISTSQDIYSNLALEEFIYTNVDMNEKNLLLIWRNKPCIVIGRHQNPWEECNLQESANHSIDIARRQSGGGTVYHDLGNVCFTFFTDRSSYNRKSNLSLLRNVLVDEWDLNVEISDRDDLILDDQYKISGTGAKLGRLSAYHHFTLLLDVNRHVLHKSLHTNMSGITSRATQSLRLPVVNLQERRPTMNYQRLVSALCNKYQQIHNIQTDNIYIDPSNERKFPGIHALRSKLKSWNWVYGKSPKFTISKQRKYPSDNPDITNKCAVGLTLQINNGKIQECDLEVIKGDDPDFSGVKLCGLTTLLAEQLIGRNFTHADLIRAMSEFSSRPQLSDPVTSDPVTSDPVTSDPVTSDSVRFVYDVCCDVITDMFS